MHDPSWRAAVAGARREPVQAATVAAATALLVVAASAGMLTAWSSGQAAIEQLAAAGDGLAVTSASLDLTVTLPPAAPEIAAAVDARLDELDGYGRSALQVTAISWLVRSGAERVEPVLRANGRIARAVPFHREGAIESLEVVAGPDPTGEVWLPADLAERLRLEPGDPLEVGLEPVGAAATRSGAATVLAGTYATVDGRPVGVLQDARLRLPPAPGDLARPAALVLTDAVTMDRLGQEVGDLQVTTLQVPATRPPRYEDLRSASDQVEQLQRDLVDPQSPVGALVFERFNGPAVRVGSDIRRLVTQAEQTATAVADQTGGAATGGVLLAAATLAAAVVAAARRGSAQTRLELVQGSAPSAVAARGALQLLPAVVLGAVVGRIAVLPLAGPILPGTRVPATAAAALTPRAAAVLVVALVVVLAVRGVDARVRLAALGGWERARTVPVVPMLLVAAGVVTLGVVVGPPRPPTDPLVMVLPILVIAAVAVLALRVVVRLVPTGGGREGEPSAGWLARRRLGGQSARLVAVGAIVATAAGMVANTSVLWSSGGVAVEAKAAALAGADAVIGVPTPTVTDVDVPLPPHTVVVLDSGLRVLPDEQPATLLAVDAATFAAIATWPAGTGPTVLQSVTGADVTGLPVLLVDAGGTVDDRGTLERGGWWTLPYEVVGRPSALPGSDPDRPTLLTTQEALFSRLGAELDPRRGPLEEDSADLDGPWSTEVWLHGPVEGAIGVLAAAQLPGQRGAEVRRTLDGVRTQTPFLAAVWSLGVLGGLAVVVLALALLLLAGTRSRADDVAALELALLERLGIPRGRQRLAAVLERVLLVVAAGVVGVAAGVALAGAARRAGRRPGRRRGGGRPAGPPRGSQRRRRGGAPCRTLRSPPAARA